MDFLSFHREKFWQRVANIKHNVQKANIWQNEVLFNKREYGTAFALSLFSQHLNIGKKIHFKMILTSFS